MITSTPSRRVFIGAAASVAAVGAFAASQHLAETLGLGEDDGGITVRTADAGPLAMETVPTDAWRAAIDTPVRIAGEHGLVNGRIVSVAEGTSGGDRPATIRQDTVLVYFETASDYAPDGDRTYDIESVVTGAPQLFLTRGQDVFGKAILMAIIN